MMNKDSEIPLYVQIKDYIHKQIASGQLMPGSRVMSESEMSDMFKISRITVRKAYGELVDEGCLVRKKGKGTFIRDIRFQEDTRSTSFSATCAKLGMVPGGKVLDSGFVTAPEDVARALGVEPGQRIAYMMRLRYADGIPVRLERNYYAPRYADIIQEDLNGSTRSILQKKFGVTETGKIRSVVEIAYTSAQESKLLGTKRSAPVLKVTGTLHGEDGGAIYASEMLHLPDRCVLIL